MTALWHDYPARWTYEHGLVLKGIERVWAKTRAMGWYAMALVETLDYFPNKHPQRAELIAILKNHVRDSGIR